MAEKKTIELEVKSNLDSAERSVGSLKSQLRQAQAEVAALSDKFGATSREAVGAAQKAAVLADKIGDAKALTEAFNPDAKFKSLSASLSGVAGGFAAYQGALGLVGVESKELEQQLLRVQSAMAIAEGLQGLGEAQDSFKQLKAVGVNAFNSIKTAIGSTGIGLIVVAAGAIYAYWDDIKGAVSGVSEEQKTLNSLSQENADQEEEKLKSLNSQDNVLKLQGKSEKEILNIKIKATNEAISAAKINIKNQEITNALAVEGAKRNYEYLKSFIDFISIPQRMIFETGAKAINKMIDLINKIPGVEIKGKIDETFANKASEYITKLGFDPEKTKSKGEETIKAAKDSLNKMVNDRAGMQLAINEIDKKASDDSKKTKDEAKQNAIDQEKEDLDNLNNALKAQNDAKIAAENELTQAIGEAQDKQSESLLTAQQVEERNINDKYFRLLEMAKQQQRSKEEIDALEIAQLNELNDVRLKADETATTNAKTQSEERIKTAQAEAQQKKDIQEASFALASGAVNFLKEIGGKNKAIQKAAIIAENAIGIGKMIIANNAANIGALATPQAILTSGASAIPVIAMNNITTALGVATTIASTAKALSAVGGGSAGGSGSVGASSGGRAAPAAPAFNVVGASSTNQLAQTIGNQQQQPIKAYVVANDVTTQQSLDRNIVQSASIG